MNFAALNTELLPLNEAMRQSRSCRLCGAWEAMQLLELVQDFFSPFMPTVYLLKFFCIEFWKVSPSKECKEADGRSTMYIYIYVYRLIHRYHISYIYYSRCHWGSAILLQEWNLITWVCRAIAIGMWSTGSGRSSKSKLWRQARNCKAMRWN